MMRARKEDCERGMTLAARQRVEKAMREGRRALREEAFGTRSLFRASVPGELSERIAKLVEPSEADLSDDVGELRAGSSASVVYPVLGSFRSCAWASCISCVCSRSYSVHRRWRVGSCRISSAALRGR